jgi:hypothetical protein
MSVVKPSRCDGIYLNVMPSPLGGQIFGEDDDATFASAVAEL